MISKMSTLPTPGKISADAHVCMWLQDNFVYFWITSHDKTIKHQSAVWDLDVAYGIRNIQPCHTNDREKSL